MSQKNIGMLQMVLCSILWSTSGILIKLIDMNPLCITGFRSFFAALTVLAYMLITKKRFIFNKTSFLTGLILSGSFFCIIGANKYTTAANAVVLQFTNPIFILIISVLFLKMKISRKDIITLFFVLLGIVLSFCEDMNGGGLFGNILGIFAGLFLALLFIFCGGSGGSEKITGILTGHIISSTIGLSFLPFTQNTLDYTTFFYLFLLGVFQIGLAYIFFSLASGKCSPLACSIISVIEPVFNPVWVFLFAGEIPGPIALCGFAIIVVSITLWSVIGTKEKA